MAKIVPGYLGIDPGVNGGMALIRGSSVAIWNLSRMTTSQVWRVLYDQAVAGTLAVIEEQVPRPTRWFNGKTWVSSILKSTCILYGSYRLLHGLLVASGMGFSAIPPQEWQKYHSLSKVKSEKDSVWKGRLKDLAISLLPQEGARVTLATADAVLLAIYCKKRREQT